jgi:hypothetical protein
VTQRNLVEQMQELNRKLVAQAQSTGIPAAQQVRVPAVAPPVVIRDLPRPPVANPFQRLVPTASSKPGQDLALAMLKGITSTGTPPRAAAAATATAPVVAPATVPGVSAAEQAIASQLAGITSAGPQALKNLKTTPKGMLGKLKGLGKGRVGPTIAASAANQLLVQPLLDQLVNSGEMGVLGVKDSGAEDNPNADRWNRTLGDAANAAAAMSWTLNPWIIGGSAALGGLAGYVADSMQGTSAQRTDKLYGTERKRLTQALEGTPNEVKDKVLAAYRRQASRARNEQDVRAASDAAMALVDPMLEQRQAQMTSMQERLALQAAISDMYAPYAQDMQRSAQESAAILNETAGQVPAAYGNILRAQAAQQLANSNAGIAAGALTASQWPVEQWLQRASQAAAQTTGGGGIDALTQLLASQEQQKKKE